jgi:hypothetical protein
MSWKAFLYYGSAINVTFWILADTKFLSSRLSLGFRNYLVFYVLGWPFLMAVLMRWC